MFWVPGTNQSLSKKLDSISIGLAYIKTPTLSEGRGFDMGAVPVGIEY
jgi:hypothetical protein